MKLAERMPESMRERLAPRIKQAETFVREWEWTWTRAVMTALILWFVAIALLILWAIGFIAHGADRRWYGW